MQRAGCRGRAQRGQRLQRLLGNEVRWRLNEHAQQRHRFCSFQAAGCSRHCQLNVQRLEFELAKILDQYQRIGLLVGQYLAQGTQCGLLRRAHSHVHLLVGNDVEVAVQDRDGRQARLVIQRAVAGRGAQRSRCLFIVQHGGQHPQTTAHLRIGGIELTNQHWDRPVTELRCNFGRALADFGRSGRVCQRFDGSFQRQPILKRGDNFRRRVAHGSAL